MSRKLYHWKLRDTELQLGDRTLIMGVLNLTPDSFSDGGRFSDPDRAYARALELQEQGADIIDIGAESTRPGSERINADEEWQRLVPVLKRLRDQLHIPLSLDTYKSEIAERALQYGVQIFNDPSGLTFDPGLAKVAANGNAGLILNHMRGTPETWPKLPPMPDPLGMIAQELNATVSRARLAGVDRTRIMVDPGLGFGKRKEQNSEIIAKLQKLAAALDYPILIGASRKSFLAQATEADTQFATAAAVAIAALNGAHIVRVHDVKQMQSVLLVADEIARAATVELPAEAAATAVKAARPRTRPQHEFEEEKPRAMRPPLAKPPVIAAAEPAETEAEPLVEAAATEAVTESTTEVPAATSPVETGEGDATPELASEAADSRPIVPTPAARPLYVKREGGKSSEDRGKAKGGWAPPPRRDDGPGRRDFRPSGDRPQRSGDRPQGDRPQYDRPQYDRPQYDRPRFDRPNSDRPPSDRPSYDRPRGDRPSFDRPRSDRPSFDRPRFDRPGGDRPSGDRPRFDRPSGDRPSFDRPRFDRPRFDRPGGDRPPSDRPRFDRPGGDRPSGDRPRFDRPRFDKPGGDRPSGDRPRFDKPRFDRPGGDRPRFDKPRGDGPPRRDNPGGNRGDGPPPRRPFRKRP